MRFIASTLKSLERQHRNSRRNYAYGKFDILANTHLDAKNAKGWGELFSRTSGIIPNIKRKTKIHHATSDKTYQTKTNDKRDWKNSVLGSTGYEWFFFFFAVDQAFDELKRINGPDENLKCSENLPYIYPVTSNTVANRLKEQNNLFFKEWLHTCSFLSLYFALKPGLERSVSGRSTAARW